MNPTLETIEGATLSVLGINKKFFRGVSKSRSSNIVKAKQIICFIAKELGYTSIQISKKLGIGHSTVLYHVKKAEGFLGIERDYARCVEAVMTKLGLRIEHHTVTGWILRDKEEEGGYLYLTIGEEPKRGTQYWIVEDGMMIDLPKEFFSQVTWHTPPQKCEMTLRLK